MRYLIVGYGNIGHKREGALGNKCAATVDPNPNTKADYKNVLDVPPEIFDAVVLTVPQQNKLELTRYFLSKGKHILVEKPLIITPRDARELLSLARKNNVIWYTSYNHRFEPNIVKIKNFIERGFLGPLYHARFVYSFGNIKERIGTWRETEFGVLEEIVPHQLDFVMRFFGYKGRDFKTIIARKVESDIFDHWLISTTDQKVLIELSAVTWKNVFAIDIYGKNGSIHMKGLNKWQGSSLSVHTRVLPSGAPKEKISQTSGLDLTWKKDFKYFGKMVRENIYAYKNDLEVSIALTKLSKEAKKTWKNN